jgi:signal transduction histidine kinase
MLVPPTPKDESRRLAALYDYHILDTPGEETFDAFARMAAAMCGTPIALIGLIDAERIWFKANVGLPGIAELPRAAAICSQAILSTELYEVPDTHLDERFRDADLVVGAPHVRFYAGVPLIAAGGHALGTISVIDRTPRRLTDDQRRALLALSEAIVKQLDARRHTASAKEQVDLLMTAIEEIEDSVVISRPGRHADDGPTIVYANAAFVRQKRGTREQLIGMDLNRFIGERTERAPLIEMREAMLRGDSSRVNYIGYRLDGTHYYATLAARPLIDELGKTSHFVVIEHDTTDAVLRGEQLEMQNERLTALTAIARGIFAALEPHPLVEALLVGARELVGADARLLVARPNGGFAVTRDLALPERAPPAGDDFIESASRSDMTSVEAGARRAAIRIPGSLGQTRYILDVRSERPLNTADVFALGLLGQYFAVAARNVELYNELQTRRAAVVELNQVKNDLIAMLAHDFKGPLTTIVGFADVLAEDDRFDDEARKFLNMISSSAMRLASLATDTLALSRLEQNELALTIEEVDLVGLVREIVRVFSVTRAIDLRADRPQLVIGGDPGRLRQVFENLIGNAIKYSPGGEAVEVTLRAKGRGVEATVRDHGIGIPEADKPKLFGRFARAQNARAMGIGGTGFGLYLTKTIVEMHGGQIAVDSREGEGSIFRVFLPSSLTAQRPKHRRFVLVDPDGDARSYLAHTLRDDGGAATVVANGKELLDVIDETQFDAAFVDIERLGMKPDEFVRRVAGRAALIRIDPAPVPESDGWDGYLVKPFLVKDLLAVIEAALMRQTRASSQALSTPA